MVRLAATRITAQTVTSSGGKVKIKKTAMRKPMKIEYVEKDDVFYIQRDEGFEEEDDEPMMLVDMDVYSDNTVGVKIRDSDGGKWTFDISKAFEALQASKIIVAVSLASGVIHLLKYGTRVRVVDAELMVEPPK